MAIAVVALGSNVGNALQHLQSANRALGTLLSDLRSSSVYRTAPMYVTNQPDFLNAVVLGESHLGPLPLLQQLKGLEQELGRHVRKRYGPREIDLDLIAYGSVLYRLEGRLEVPHPRVAERRFVLAPLAELDPERYLPGIGRVASLLKSTIGEPADVVRLTDAVLSI